MAKSELGAVPIAIVIAGALIGGGLFLGLRERADVGSPAPSSLATQVAVAPPSPQQTSGPTGLPSAGKATAYAAVEKQLESTKAAIGKKCWQPAVAVQPSPDHAKWTLEYTFDESGKQASRGVSEDRETSRAEVTKCVLAELPALQIPAPGQKLSVAVPYQLP